MRREHHQAAALPEAALLKAIPRTEGFARTAFVPAEASGAAQKPMRQNRTLLRSPGITLPGAALWRRPGRRTRGSSTTRYARDAHR